MAGVLNRALTTVDAVRHVVLWMDTWQTDKSGQVLSGTRIAPPPIGVPVPVKPGGAPTSSAPAPSEPPPPAVAGPQAGKQVNLSVFEID